MKNKAFGRLPTNAISRDLKKEAIYAYSDGESSLKVIGQISAGSSIQKKFCLIITIYDRDGDIIASEASSGYGSGLVTSMIEPESYFDGFPFMFYCLNIKWNEVAKIEIAPADSY